jgi:hypothetical protein
VGSEEAAAVERLRLEHELALALRVQSGMLGVQSQLGVPPCPGRSPERGRGLLKRRQRLEQELAPTLRVQ